MSTGKVESFAESIADIGPLYPFVGWEWLMVIFAVVFWLGWHVRQYRIEKREYEQELDKHVNKAILERVFEREESDPGV